jgi:hypothetical protein
MVAAGESAIVSRAFPVVRRVVVRGSSRRGWMQRERMRGEGSGPAGVGERRMVRVRLWVCGMSRGKGRREGGWTSWTLTWMIWIRMIWKD